MYVAIIGGGLAGLLAAIRLQYADCRVALIDQPLPAAAGQLGGFAKFSGAKFSLPPAGMGLVQITENRASLDASINDVLAILNLPPHSLQEYKQTENSIAEEFGFRFRGYRSYVLSPKEVSALVQRLSDQLSIAEKIIGHVVNLEQTGNHWRISVQPAHAPNRHLIVDRVVYAGGRLGSEIIERTGAIEQTGKGIDIGVRVEFEDKSALSSLRELGPDAKVLMDRCRTFCLNYPGNVYRYEFRGILIPGGVVAHAETQSANVGLLVRMPNKSDVLKRILTNFERLQSTYPRLCLSSVGSRGVIDDGILSTIFPEDAIDALNTFVEHLGRSRLIDWNTPYTVHFPLIDWHWSTYALPGSLRTSINGLYVAGDISGHARGFLQAAVSGWLCAEACIK